MDSSRLEIRLPSKYFNLLEKNEKIKPFIRNFIAQFFEDFYTTDQIYIYISDNVHETECKLMSEKYTHLTYQKDGCHFFYNDIHHVVIRSYLFAMFQQEYDVPNKDKLILERNSTIFHEFMHVKTTIERKSQFSYKQQSLIHMAENIFEEYIVTFKTFNTFNDYTFEYTKCEDYFIHSIPPLNIPTDLYDIYNIIYLMNVIIVAKHVDVLKGYHKISLPALLQSCDSQLTAILLNLEKLFDILPNDNNYLTDEQWIQLFSTHIKNLSDYFNILY